MRILHIVITLLILSGSQSLAQTDGSITSAQKIISDQISAFLEGDNARAFSHAAPQIKNLFTTPDKFITMVKRGYQPLFLPNSYRFTKNKFKDGNLYQELIVTGEGGKKWRAGYSLKLQGNDEWKIVGVLLQVLGGDAI